jgi:hypothetical protein
VQLTNFVVGQWRAGAGPGQLFVIRAGTELARASSEGIDPQRHCITAVEYGPAARPSYAERAQLPTRIADVLTANGLRI